MTQETFNKAIEINKKIEEYKAFLKAYDSIYFNVIRAEDYNDKLENISKNINLKNEPELEIIIKKYVMNKIEVLEQEFAKLN